MTQRALLAAGDPASRDRLGRQLQAFGLEVTAVGSGERLIEQLLITEIDIVFIDLNLVATEVATDGGDAGSPAGIDAEARTVAGTVARTVTGADTGIDTIVEIAQLIRGSGQTAPIIVVASRLSESDQARLHAPDCRLLSTPIDPAALQALLESCLQTRTSASLAATPAGLDEEELRALQSAFVEMLNSNYLDALESALEQQSASQTQAVLHKLKGGASSFGFEQLGALAASAEALLRQGRSLDEVRAQIAPILAEAERLQQSIR
ncbi:MAG: Hpt domain-containing protein [Halochromatium sp.]|uniref:Hpt domain-containing protein n=1 Tax=Halochromatium sp. TaxID=2049430 RepID=UPI0039781450